jgi:transposase
MKRHIVNLTDTERQHLMEFTRTGKHSAQAIARARILLLADTQGQARNDADIARALGISVHTVEVTRKRYALEGLEGVLARKPRKDRGRPVKVDARVEAHIVATACSDTPNGEPEWTLAMIADHVVMLGVVDSISRERVRQTLKKTR